MLQHYWLILYKIHFAGKTSNTKKEKNTTRFSILFYLIFVDIKCGGGFYVRSLVHDLGEGAVSETFIIYRTCPLKIKWSHLKSILSVQT